MKVGCSHLCACAYESGAGSPSRREPLIENTKGEMRPALRRAEEYSPFGSSEQAGLAVPPEGECNKRRQKNRNLELELFWPTEVRAPGTMARLTGPERRREGRLRLPQTVRVRPADPQRNEFDGILPTPNTARDSVCFDSKNEFYTEGLCLFITIPIRRSGRHQT